MRSATWPPISARIRFSSSVPPSIRGVQQCGRHERLITAGVAQQAGGLDRVLEQGHVVVRAALVAIRGGGKGVSADQQG